MQAWWTPHPWAAPAARGGRGRSKPRRQYVVCQTCHANGICSWSYFSAKPKQCAYCAEFFDMPPAKGQQGFPPGLGPRTSRPASPADAPPVALADGTSSPGQDISQHPAILALLANLAKSSDPTDVGVLSWLGKALGADPTKGASGASDGIAKRKELQKLGNQAFKLKRQETELEAEVSRLQRDLLAKQAKLSEVKKELSTIDSKCKDLATTFAEVVQAGRESSADDAAEPEQQEQDGDVTMEEESQPGAGGPKLPVQSGIKRGQKPGVTCEGLTSAFRLIKKQRIESNPDWNMSEDDIQEMFKHLGQEATTAAKEATGSAASAQPAPAAPEAKAPAPAAAKAGSKSG